MAPQDGGWAGYRNKLEAHRIAGRIAFASEHAPGVRLATVLARAADWSVVSDLAGALFAVRRLLSIAEGLQAATGSPSFAISSERVIVTPRAALLLLEPDAETFESRAEGGNGARMDIAEIAIVGVSLIAGRAVDAIEATDPQSPLLKEIRDATAIRADMSFAGALHEWLDRALGADPRSGFADFRSARAALDDLHPPKGSGCRASRRVLRTFLSDLQLPDFENPKLSVLEIERGRELRRAAIARRPPPGAAPAHHDDDDSWSSLDFSDSPEPAAPPAPEPPPAFEAPAYESSFEYEEYKPGEIPGSFQLPEPEPEPEPEESSVFVAPSKPEPEPEDSSIFVKPSAYASEPESDQSSVFVTPSQVDAPPAPAADSVWGTRSYSSESSSAQSKPAPAEDPNSWIPNEARSPEERRSDEPMTMSWLPGEARQAIRPSEADSTGWMFEAKQAAPSAPAPIEPAPPPPAPPPPVAKAAPPVAPKPEPQPAPPPPVEDDKDWFKPASQEAAPPADDDKDWFKSAANQPAPPAEDDKDWFKAGQAAAPAAEETDEEEEEEAAPEEWFPEPSQQLHEQIPPSDLPPQAVALPPPETAGWDKRVAPLREEADLAPQPDLDAGPATIVHGAGASIIEKPYVPPPAPVEEAPKPKRERTPRRIETPSAGRAIGTSLVTALLAGGVVFGLFKYAHMSTPGTVTFETKPMGLELLQDGVVKGKTPMTLSLSPGTYEFALRRGKTTKPFHIEVQEAKHVTQKVDFTSLRPVGTLVINTDPPGAKITLDGKSRGVSPQTINDLAIGPHTVVLEGEQGTLRRQINVEEQDTTTITEGIFPGFLKVDASFDVKVMENGRVIGSSDGQISMRAGRHEIELVNEGQNYRETRTIDISPGEIKRILAK